MSEMVSGLNGEVVKVNRIGASKKSNGTNSNGKKVKTPSRSEKEKNEASKKAMRWAGYYTCTAVILSSGLNAYAAIHETTNEYILGQVFSGLIGAIIPVLVWILGTMVAYTFKAGWVRLAMVGGVIACCVLALSVVHVAAALALLTGSNLLMSGLLAIGIDCGLVTSEVTAILVGSSET